MNKCWYFHRLNHCRTWRLHYGLSCWECARRHLHLVRLIQYCYLLFCLILLLSKVGWRHGSHPPGHSSPSGPSNRRMVLEICGLSGGNVDTWYDLTNWSKLFWSSWNTSNSSTTSGATTKLSQRLTFHEGLQAWVWYHRPCWGWCHPCWTLLPNRPIRWTCSSTTYNSSSPTWGSSWERTWSWSSQRPVFHRDFAGCWTLTPNKSLCCFAKPCK